MNKGLPKPEKTYVCGQYRLMIYTEINEIWAISRSGTTIIIKGTTEQINNLPKYVIAFLQKKGLLRKWETEQIRRSVTKLTDLVNRYAEAKKRELNHAVSSV